MVEKDEMPGLGGKTIFITGATRGIGRAIALRCARDGANVVVTGKTDTPHPQLKGTIHSVAHEVEAAGGRALALKLDVRDGDAVRAAVDKAAEVFGGIDILVNNASAILLAPTLQTSMKRFDLMFDVNVRATFACSQACIPYLAKGRNPHILNLAPPLNLDPRWFKDHVAYTMSKYGMSLCTLGMAAELAPQRIAVNSLWPRTTIATAAIEVHFPHEILNASRRPEIVADAAHTIFRRDSSRATGNFYIDEDVLRDEGVTDFTQYAVTPGTKLYNDLFLE
ncbi:MAG TPA: NAD(P)-dependent oxidoreductase [Burkholderiales bacterium]|jgi:citronellol/citronellal dehydrogenase|nr:NAD(P)-dependent oxidoreductase [Burkholderiales bacterium]